MREGKVNLGDKFRAISSHPPILYRDTGTVTVLKLAFLVLSSQTFPSPPRFFHLVP